VGNLGWDIKEVGIWGKGGTRGDHEFSSKERAFGEKGDSKTFSLGTFLHEVKRG